MSKPTQQAKAAKQSGMSDFLKLHELVSSVTVKLYDRKRELAAKRVYGARYNAFSDDPSSYLAGLASERRDDFLTALMAQGPEHGHEGRGWTGAGQYISELANALTLGFSYPPREATQAVSVKWCKVTRNGRSKWYPPEYFTADPDAPPGSKPMGYRRERQVARLKATVLAASKPTAATFDHMAQFGSANEYD